MISSKQASAIVLLWLLTPALRLSPALHTLRLRPIDVVCGDPALVISLCPRGHRWPVSSNNGHLISRVDLLRLARRFLCALSALSTTALLREQSADPGAVDKVAGASEGGAKEQVEEDAGHS